MARAQSYVRHAALAGEAIQQITAAPPGNHFRKLIGTKPLRGRIVSVDHVLAPMYGCRAKSATHTDLALLRAYPSR